MKDQEQYWSEPYRPYRYISVGKFAQAFRNYSTGKSLYRELDMPFDRRYNHPAALSTTQYGVSRKELFRTGFDWQLLLMKRNSFIYVFKFFQVCLPYVSRRNGFWDSSYRMCSVFSAPARCVDHHECVLPIDNSS